MLWEPTISGQSYSILLCWGLVTESGSGPEVRFEEVSCRSSAAIPKISSNLVNSFRLPTTSPRLSPKVAVAPA